MPRKTGSVWSILLRQKEGAYAWLNPIPWGKANIVGCQEWAKGNYSLGGLAVFRGKAGFTMEGSSHLQSCFPRCFRVWQRMTTGNLDLDQGTHSSVGKRAPHTRSRGRASLGIPGRLLIATGHRVSVLSPQADSSLWKGGVWHLVLGHWSAMDLLTTLFSPHLPMRQGHSWNPGAVSILPSAPTPNEYDFHIPAEVWVPESIGLVSIEPWLNHLSAHPGILLLWFAQISGSLYQAMHTVRLVL